MIGDEWRHSLDGKDCGIDETRTYGRQKRTPAHLLSSSRLSAASNSARTSRALAASCRRR
jgi:hypothetical protein